MFAAIRELVGNASSLAPPPGWATAATADAGHRRGGACARMAVDIGRRPPEGGKRGDGVGRWGLGYRWRWGGV